MACDDPATNSLTAVPIERDWWRLSLFSDTLYKCEYTGACENGTCTKGHGGTACRVCEADHYYDSLKNRCESCGSGSGGDVFLIAVGVVAFALLLVAAFAAMRSSSDGAGLLERASSLWKDGLQGTLEGQLDEMAEEQEGDLPWWQDAALWRSIRIKLKIVLGV